MYKVKHQSEKLVWKQKNKHQIFLTQQSSTHTFILKAKMCTRFTNIQQHVQCSLHDRDLISLEFSALVPLYVHVRSESHSQGKLKSEFESNETSQAIFNHETVIMLQCQEIQNYKSTIWKLRILVAHEKIGNCNSIQNFRIFVHSFIPQYILLTTHKFPKQKKSQLNTSVPCTKHKA